MRKISVYLFSRIEMSGYVDNLAYQTQANHHYRQVVYTTPTRSLQLVLMSIPPNTHIGMEVHSGDQYIQIESGTGQVIINQQMYNVGPGYGIIIPRGIFHDVINTSQLEPLQLYTLYTPAQH